MVEDAEGTNTFLRNGPAVGSFSFVGFERFLKPVNGLPIARCNPCNRAAVVEVCRAGRGAVG